jgi:hypothetical protein
MDAITGKVVIPTKTKHLLIYLHLAEWKMLGTIWLIICAMVLVDYGCNWSLSRISQTLLKWHTPHLDCFNSGKLFSL